MRGVSRSGLAAAFWLAAATGASAQCLESERKVGSAEMGEASVRELLCKAPGEALPSIRIEFQRLDSTVASILLEGRSSPEMTAAFGRPAAIQNAVFVEFMNVLRTLGKEEDLTQCAGDEGCTISLLLNRGDQYATVYVKNLEGNRLTKVPSDPLPHPAVALNEAMKAGRTWPAGFGMTYQEGMADALSQQFGFKTSKGGGEPPIEVYLWKHVTPADFANFETELARHNAVVRKKTPREDLDYYLLKEGEPSVRRYERLGALPEDFFVLTGVPAYDACDESAAPLCCWSFYYHVRGAALDVAVVENVTGSPLALTALIGTATSEKTFRAPRPAGAVVTGARELDDFGELKLGAGERLLVPLAIVFPPGTYNPFGDLEQAREIFASRIQSKPPGTIFAMGKGANKNEKAKESFAPPSGPQRRTYVYGPEVALAGIAINGRRIDLQASDPSILAMTAGTGEGSCPYLTAWNPETGRWSEFGKVLDKAKGKKLEQSQTIRLGAFRSRFRLAEREPEIAHIDAARLIVETRSAQSIALETSNARLAKADGNYASFMWGETIEFGFDLPPGLEEEDVVSSELILTGFYERYTALAQQESAGATPVNGEAVSD